MLNYVLQGLYHPARESAGVYRNIPTRLRGADALTQYYPALESDETHSTSGLMAFTCGPAPLPGAQSYEHGVSPIRRPVHSSSRHHRAAADSVVVVVAGPGPGARTHAERGAQANRSLRSSTISVCAVSRRRAPGT